jgi:hypothetical protein
MPRRAGTPGHVTALTTTWSAKRVSAWFPRNGLAYGSEIPVLRFFKGETRVEHWLLPESRLTHTKLTHTKLTQSPLPHCPYSPERGSHHVSGLHPSASGSRIGHGLVGPSLVLLHRPNRAP